MGISTMNTSETETKSKKATTGMLIHTSPTDLFELSEEQGKPIIEVLKRWKLIEIPGIVYYGPGASFIDNKWVMETGSIWITFNNEFDIKNFVIPTYVKCQVNAWEGWLSQ
jgi:hypothetical protein